MARGALVKEFNPMRPNALGNPRPYLQGGSRLPLVLALAVTVITAGARPCRAGLSLEVLNSTAPAGGTGSLDVLLTNNDSTGSMPFQITGFSAELSVSPTSGITFTSADTNTTAPYIFGSLQSPPF